MLKRQRASSPFPQSPSMPQDITSEGIFDVRDLKRRRVAQPSVDGWDAHSKSTAGDCREEDSVEEKRHGRSREKSAQSDRNTEYAEVNNMLKEMHILHQHRQMFVPNSSQSHLLHHEHNKSHSSHHPEQQTLAEESARVYEHYEGTNRSLASAFLSRRQHSAGQPY